MSNWFNDEIKRLDAAEMSAGKFVPPDRRCPICEFIYIKLKQWSDGICRTCNAALGRSREIEWPEADWHPKTLRLIGTSDNCAEIARELGLTQPAVWKWFEKGEAPGRWVGKIPHEHEVSEWILCADWMKVYRMSGYSKHGFSVIVGRGWEPKFERGVISESVFNDMKRKLDRQKQFRDK